MKFLKCSESVKWLLPSLVLLAAVQTSADTGKIVDYQQCTSGELTVVLNKYDKASKKDLIAGLEALASYADLSVAAANSQGPELKYSVSASDCSAEKREKDGCPEPKSWSVLQWRLKTIKATEVTCREADEQDQDGGQGQDQGGATGEN